MGPGRVAASMTMFQVTVGQVVVDAYGQML
jgi:hypothetical protein